MNRLVKISLALVLLLSQTGCWDQKTLKETIFASATSFEKGKKGKIITNVALSVFRYFNFKQTLTETANQPRYHHQHLPDILYYEEGAFDAGAVEKLTKMGHVLKARDNYGNLNIIARQSARKKWEAASDKRRGGKAVVLH